MNKKRIASILSFVLAVNLMPGIGKNINAFAANIPMYLQADFENYIGPSYAATNIVQNGVSLSLGNVNNNNYFTNESVDNDHNNSILFKTTAASPHLQISKSGLNISSKSVVDVDVFLKDKKLQRRVMIRQKLSDAAKAPSTTFSELVVFNTNGTVTLGVGGAQLLSNYDINKWYNVKLVVDTTTHTADIYINNELKKSNHPLPSATYNNTAGVSVTDTWDVFNEARIVQFGNAVGGEMLIDNLNIYKYYDIKDISIDKSLTLGVGTQIKLNPIIGPVEASNQGLRYTSNNPSVASVDYNGKVSANSIGTAEISISSLDGSISTKCELNVLSSFNKVVDIKLPTRTEVQKGETLELSGQVEFNPIDATNKTLIWKSSDPRKATVDSNGVVTGINKGVVTITAETQDGGKTASTTLDIKHIVNAPVVDDAVYDNLRLKWFNDLTGGNYNYNDPNVKALVDKVVTDAQNYWTSMDKSPSRTHLWADLDDSSIDPTLTQANKDLKKSEYITTAYKRIEAMARAYQMNNSPLKGDANLLADLLDALEWMYQNRYNENLNVEYGNWWNWEIGVPQVLENACVLLYNDIPKDNLTKYMKAIYFYMPDPFNNCYTELNPTNPTYKLTTGANRVDCARISALMGILTKDYEQLLMAKDATESVLVYSTEGDGFYTDGSFIQHKDQYGLGATSYVGGYGNVFFAGVPTIASLLQGSPWEISSSKLQILKEFVDNALKPFIYNGIMLDMMRGRGISRSAEDAVGHTSLNAMMLIARIITDPVQKSEMYSFVKQMIQSDTSYDHMYNMRGVNLNQYPISLMNDLNRILNDPNIVSSTKQEYQKNLPMSDRAVHAGDNYLFGVAMFSTRITNFESMNNENKRGWYTNAGMTYLYNDDLNYYINYWPTINPYRIPGTTVDTVTMIDGKGNKCNSDRDWVGGTVLGNYGINGMDYHAVGPKGLINTQTKEVDRLSLEAKKSWFMFDDEIVALGAGINSTDGRNIETIVDNRKLKSDNSNEFSVNGINQNLTLTQQNITNDPKPNSDSQDIMSANWAYISGNVSGADVGYYFPNKTNLKVRNVENTGTWQAIGSSGPVDSNDQPLNITNNYLEMWFDHGVNPTDASYEYVMLPNKTKQQVEEYSKNPSITVLSNTSSVQAVKENKLNMIGANFFTDTVQNIDFITANKKSSIMTKESADYLEISISDPTMKNNETIEVELNKQIESVVSADSEVTVTQLGPTIKLSVNVNNSNGDTFKVKFKKIDTTAPKVVGVEDGKVYDKAVKISFDEGTATLDEAEFTNESEVSAEGQHTLVVTDAAGNKTTLTFTIDTTAPKVVGVEEGKVYDKAVKVSFDEGIATLDGEKFTNESEVSAEGQHTLVVTDAVGNKTTLTFTVDTIAPQISIAGVKDGEVYKNTTIKPEVVANESAKITYELDGKVVELLGEIDAIGKHYLEITAVDKAGNESNVKLVFEIKGSLEGSKDIGQTLKEILQKLTGEVKIELNDNKEIPLKAFEMIKTIDKNIGFIVNSQGMELVWKFNPKNIKVIEKDMDFNLNEVAPYKNEILKYDSSSQVISFKYHGNLPAPMTVTIPVDISKIDATKPVNFFWYNPTTKKAEEIQSKILPYEKDGKYYIDVELTHCSDYFITQVDVESIIAKNDSNTSTNGNNNTNTDDVNNNNDIIKETSDKELNDVKASKDLPKTGSRVSTDVLTTTSLIILALGVALMVRPRKREQ